MNQPLDSNAATPKRPFVFVGGGLGDVARRFYLSDTYELLGTRTEPLFVLCFSHNPAALDFFRFHPNHKHLMLMDLGHIYMSLIHDPKFDNKKINETLFAMCGFSDADLIARRRDPKPIGRFYAPDSIANSTGHVVVHPFGRGWGDWPHPVNAQIREALRIVPSDVRVFVVCADYFAADGRRKFESFQSDQPNVTVLKNLSAPAVFSLVASSSRFIGNISALAQVAAFEGIPSIVLHPGRCIDFKPPFNDYSRTIWKSGGIAINYDTVAPATLAEILRRFLKDIPNARFQRSAFDDFVITPAF